MPGFEVERFEHVSATPETALLRISGHWSSRKQQRLSPPMLVIDDGRRTHRLAALPGPDDAAPLAGPERPRWRAAYSAPAEVLSGARVAFALEVGRTMVDLPAPAASEVRRQAAAPARPAVPETAEVERRLEAERAARSQAERRATEMGQRIEALRSEAEERA